MKSSDSLSGLRQRPELRCITDKHLLLHQHEESSPIKHHPRHKSHYFQTCDIPDQGGGNDRIGAFSSYVAQLMTASIGFEMRNGSREKENTKRVNLKHSRSKSNVKPVKSDLKKGSFSDKQSIKNKGSQNKILYAKNEYRAISPFQLKIANTKPALPTKNFSKAKENKEEPVPQWKKYMRELSLQVSKKNKF